MYTSHKSDIINANGKVFPVETDGDVVLTNQLCLKKKTYWFPPWQQI
jgi:hypothetical protein